jgi:hypothetical protein
LVKLTVTGCVAFFDTAEQQHNNPLTNFAEIAHVAQLVEHVLGKDEVTGSIPVMGSSRAQRTFATTNQTTKHYG